MKLYYSQGACSLAVNIALREVGAKFTAHAVDLATHKLDDGSDYYKISPRGYVPVLELDDGSRYTEAAALLQYAADLDSKQALIGAIGSARRLNVTMWTTFVSTELHKSFGPLFNPTTPEVARPWFIERIKTRLTDLDAHLAKNNYLAGDYSIADAYAFTVASWAPYIDLSLEPYPAIRAFQERVGTRPAVQAALKEEGLA